VPRAFGDDALVFGVAYLVVRALHFVLSWLVVRDDPDRRGVLLRFAPTAAFGASLLVAASFLDGRARVAAWMIALAVDYLGPTVIGMGRGWRLAPEHFAERYGLIVLIALGESIIAIGVGAGFVLGTGVLVAAGFGIVVVSALWWLYFDVAAILARRPLVRATGIEQARLALDAYSYLHLPMIGGIVLFAFGLKTTIGHVGDHLHVVPAAALCGGAALYLLAHVAFLLRSTGRIWRRRSYGAIVLLALVPAAVAIPALAALGLVGAVCTLVVASEAIGRREHRTEIRSTERGLAVRREP
jgi:low temperature requirement protein LtrA